MQNNFLDNAVKSLNSYILVLKQQSQLREKNYELSEMFLGIKEVKKLHSPLRELFIECGRVFLVRKYWYYNGEIEYEARFLRFGYNIVCRSNDLAELKRKFIEEANKV